MPQGQSDPEAVPFSELAGKFLVIEEKLDGAGVSLEFNENLELITKHRDTLIVGPEFTRLKQWGYSNVDILFDVLETRYVMFGEWMYKQHTKSYNKLPFYLIESDVYDKEKNIWLGTTARAFLFKQFKNDPVPVLAQGKFDSLTQVTSLIGKSKYIDDGYLDDLIAHCERNKLDVKKVLSTIDQTNLMEGLYIKHEENDQVIGRYKFVRHEFLQIILNSGHVRDRDVIPNQLCGLTKISDWL